MKMKIGEGQKTVEDCTFFFSHWRPIRLRRVLVDGINDQICLSLCEYKVSRTERNDHTERSGLKTRSAGAPR